MTFHRTPAQSAEIARVNAVMARFEARGDAADAFAHETGILDWEDRLAEHDERESYGDARDDDDFDAAWNAWAEETFDPDF